VISFRSAVATLLALMVGACATPYQSAGPTGGYTEKSLGPGKYYLKYLGNGFTKSEVVRAYWERRASELCQGKPYKSEPGSGYDQASNVAFVGGAAYFNQHRYPTVQGIVECEQ
jgi:hypothetical protein